MQQKLQFNCLFSLGMIRLNVILLLLLLFFIPSVYEAQQSFVSGTAGFYKGKEIALYGYSDLITYTPVKESSDTVDAKGVFELTTHITQPGCYQLRIDNKVAKIYMLTLFKYGITFPAPDSSNYHNPTTDESVDLIIHGDSTELNARIIDFNEQFDLFWEKNYKYFVAKKLHGKLDSFQLSMQERYKNVKSNYFKNYMKYTFALINTNTGRHRNYIAANYLVNRPIEYHNYEYMDFFNQFFKLYLQSIASGPAGNNILRMINEDGNVNQLNTALQSDTWLQNDSLRELVMIKGLFELYYVPEFNRTNIQSMLEELLSKTRNTEHKLICANILRIFRNLQVGSPAPDFALKDALGKTHAISDFKGRYVYLHFFNSNSNESLQELKKIEQLSNLYKNQIFFISVSTDTKQEGDLKKFHKTYPTYKWLFLDAGQRADVCSQYVVKVPNQCYFINREGYLVQSPAKKPSEGIEYKFREMFQVRRR